MSDQPQVPWGNQGQTGPSAGPVPVEPGFWDKFQAARDQSSRRTYNFLRQAFTGRMPDTPEDQVEAEYAKRYHNEFSSVLGRYVGAAEDPATVGLMAYMMFGGPAAGAYRVEQGVAPFFEEEARPTANMMVRQGEGLGERLWSEAKRGAVLSQMRASDDPFYTRIGHALTEGVTSLPFALSGIEPARAAEISEGLINRLAGATPGEADRIIPSGTRIARAITGAAGRVMPSLQKAGVDLGEGIMGEGDQLLKHIIRQTGRRVFFQIPKQLAEGQAGAAVDWGEENIDDLDPDNLHNTVYRTIQGKIRRDGGLTPWEYLDTARDIHGAGNYDSDNIPDDALKEKNEAQMVMRGMLHDSFPEFYATDPTDQPPTPPSNELSINRAAWQPNLYTGLPSPEQLNLGTSSSQPWYQQPIGVSARTQSTAPTTNSTSNSAPASNSGWILPPGSYDLRVGSGE